MNGTVNAGTGPAFQTLQRLALPRAKVERCEFCSASLGPDHRHLLEVATRKIVCGCDPCALRFENVIGRWKLIPRELLRLADFQITDAQWDALALPINLAFFVRDSSSEKVIAFYPGPAGATESLLGFTNWSKLVNQNAPLANIPADVSALLVNRVGSARLFYIAPIDLCYELVGLIRVHWRGLSGGTIVWAEITKFFERIEQRSRTARKAAYA